MDEFLIILSVICAIVAIIGSIVPVLPGPILAYGALWIAKWSGYAIFTISFMVVMAIVTAIVFIADLYLPSLITKKMGGSKAAQWGAFTGTILGVFLTPVGMLIGMLVGAFVGEFMFNKSDMMNSASAAIGSFLGFLVGTGIKLFFCGYVIYEIVSQIWGVVFN